MMESFDGLWFTGLAVPPQVSAGNPSRCRDELVSATLRNRLLMDYFLPPTPLRA